MADLPEPDGVCDGGDLDCGSGLLLIIREAMAPVAGGGVLEVRSREGSVREDLPAWCRLVGHEYLGSRPGDAGADRHLVRKGGADAKLQGDLERARAFAWKVRVRWTGGMKAKAYVRNHAFEVGQPASFDTADPHPGAVEQLLAALGACLAVGFQWRASRRGIAVRQLEVTLQARSENILVFLGLAEEGHPGLHSIEGRLFVDADLDEAALRALWDETVRRSPVAQSLAREVPVRIEARPA